MATFDPNTETINVDVRMRDKLYSRKNALFQDDGNIYKLTVLSAQGKRPWKDTERQEKE